MRLWSIHFGYLDTNGLSGLWREALLAKKVLEGNTVGYKNHPQLRRFKDSVQPLAAINTYLWHVLEEAQTRRYTFNPAKIDANWVDANLRLTVNIGQLAYEAALLKRKLANRRHNGRLAIEEIVQPCRFFTPVENEMIAEWEKVQQI